MADVTFLLLQTFSSQHAPCLSTTDVPFFLSLSFYYRCSSLMLYTFLMLQKPPRTADATFLVLNTLSIGTTSVAFLIMKTFSSHHTSCRPAAAVTQLILYTLSSHCTAFSLYCRCDPPGTAHFLYSHCRCDILDTTDFLLTPSPPVTDVALLILYTLQLHCISFSSYCRSDPPGTAHFLYSYCRCDIPDTADFLLTPHTLSSYYQCSPSDTVTLSSHCTTF